MAPVGWLRTGTPGSGEGDGRFKIKNRRVGTYPGEISQATEQFGLLCGELFGC